MPVSPRWSLALGLLAFLIMGTLAVLGAAIAERGSPSESAARVPEGALPRPGSPASIASAGRGPSSAAPSRATTTGAAESIADRPAASLFPGAPPRSPASTAPGSSDRAEGSLAIRGPGASLASLGIPGLREGASETLLETDLRPILREPRLRPGVFGIDLMKGSTFTLDGDESFAAASLIKIPVAVALLTEVDGGRVSLGETLALAPSEIAAGSGHLQYQPVGTRFTISRLAELMIRKSDNTATNMLVDRLGGIDAVNRIFALWGLSRTVMREPLPDMEGANRTSPRDLVSILGRAVAGGLLHPDSRELLLSWMRHTHVRSLLPAGVGTGAIVANKTGDIPGALGDAGYVEAPGGRRYLLAVQVERPHNSHRANELIRRVSGLVYEKLTGLDSPSWPRTLRAGRPAPRRAS